MVPPPDETPKSLGDGVTGSDVEPSEDSYAQSLGDQSTTGDMGSSVSDLDAFVGDFEDDQGEVIDLESRYEIQKTLGIGGMGEVLLAQDKRLNRQVAIKRLKEELGANRKAAQRFLTEAQSVAALNHFNIVQIYDYGRAVDGPFIVMEYVGGGSLAEKLEAGALELDEAIDLTCQLCEALGAAHQAGIVHRDIKPANVLMTTEGVPKLTDFGLARQETIDGGQTQAGAMLGTLDFMPPEQKVDATQADARSDLWSLAATLYQMVTGRSPRIIKFNNVPQSLQDVLGKALEDEPADRYQTADDFRDALKSALDSPVAPKPEVVSEGELAKGQCTQCGVVNDLSRKFCEECAAALRVSCLSCEQTIPTWDKVCGECGGKQQELLVTRRTEMQKQRDQAEVLGREFDYTRSRELAERIQSESHPGLQDYQEWAIAFLAELAAAEQEQHQRVAELVREAESHRSAYDYSAATETLGRIPEPLRTPEIHGLLEKMQAAEQESSELLTTIRERAKSRELEGLLELVERGLELLPQREDLQKIKGQLEARKKKRREKKEAETIRLNEEANAYRSRGNSHLENGDYDRAISDYTEAILLNPQDAEAYFWRAYVHSQNGDNDAAIIDYTERIRLNEDYESYRNRGFAHSQNGDNDAAISDYTEAIRLNPEDALTYYWRGEAHNGIGNRAEAKADFCIAMELGDEIVK
jgi:tetratricopeptide (TPR) repeat protein